MKKKIVVFTGAGISKESGIPTFRDSDDGIYLNKSIMDMFTASGWKMYKQEILDLHNQLRTDLEKCEPNFAHIALKDLEEKYEVTIITQNVDDLHERAGSSNVIHLHGELNKSRSSFDDTIYECSGELNLGDKCPKGSQLRPHTVFFDEFPYNVEESYEVLTEADILIIVGTSLNISYTIPLLAAASPEKVYYVDPSPSYSLDGYFYEVNYIKKPATIGMNKLMADLL